jgi:hypothetical protein
VPTDDEIESMLAELLDDAPPEPPAGAVRDLRAQAEARRDMHRIAERRPRWRSVWVPAAAAAAIAVGVGFTAGRLLDSPSGSIAGEVEYDGPMSGADGSPADAHLRVVKTGIGRVVELDTDVLPILPTGELYELWFVGPTDSSGDRDRISAGTFHPDADGHSAVRFAAAVDPTKYPLVVITAEPGDGDPAPTEPDVLRARLDG